MSNWTFKYNNGTAWSSGWITINAPTNDIDIEQTSTRERQTLITGSSVWVIPSNKAVYGQSEILWETISASNSILTSGLGTYSLVDILNLGYRIQFKTHSINNDTLYKYIDCYPISLVNTYKLGYYHTPSGNMETYYDVKVNIDIRDISNSEIT